MALPSLSEDDEFMADAMPLPPTWMCPCHKLSFTDKEKFKEHLRYVASQVNAAMARVTI